MGALYTKFIRVQQVRNLALGADACNSARAMMFALGAIYICIYVYTYIYMNPASQKVIPKLRTCFAIHLISR
jgi:hypothetical protein